MKVLLVAATLLHLALGASVVDVMCPDSCTCQVIDDRLETSCVSYEFIKKLLPKQESTIVRLSINNASLVNVDLKLKYLKNLHSLDLSNNDITTLPSQFPYLPKLKNFNLSKNHLKDVVLSQLPKNLEVVDLSHNSISSLPKDWTSLKHLTTLYLHDNFIDCDNCDNLSIYEQLLKGGVVLPGNLTCYSPREFHGRQLNSINCTLIKLNKENFLNSMLGDEGSGGEEETVIEDDAPLTDDQDEFINAEDVTRPVTEAEEEGSGDEGSGDAPIVIDVTEPKACHFNCSTPHPIGTHDNEKDSSTPPTILDQAKTLFEDILQPEKEEDKEVLTTTTTQKSEIELKEVEEPPIIKTDKSDVETIPTNDTVVGEMERASLANSNFQSVYIVVGLIIAFVAFLLIYFINKKRNQRQRNQRKRNKSNENGYGEEMKPLGKSIEVPKPVEQNNSKLPISPETAPLLNGQNGKIAEDSKVRSEPEFEPDNKEMEDVELRKPDKEDTLTPQLERVTIKAGELPDSIPKTPLLVHRQLNSDGEIVTTAVNSN